MKFRPSLIESAAVAVFFLIGMLVRLQGLDREAVEHFDEGIYASVLWHDGAFGTPYPARDLYAPPLLPTMIDLSSLLPGMSHAAPFLPSAVLGLFTILALWSLARLWFGKAAGIFIAAVVAMSDFHILYSRMAMTDVPALLWIVGSVYFGTVAIQQKSVRFAILSGFVCGLAWWTKYTGWLPLAILVSGTVLWWSWVGRKQITATRTLTLLTVIVISAITTFLPWWWHLQSQGGYAAVSANHAGYMSGWSGWTNNLAQQLTFQFWLDGPFGAVSLGLGMAAAGVYRWVAAGCSTWNTLAKSAGPQTSVVDASPKFMAWKILFRFLIAAIALTVIALRIWTPLMLSCLALGGFGGMFLWPVLRRLWLRLNARDLSPTSQGSLPLLPGDLSASATVDPALGLCLTVTWFAGMLLMTPFYYPYSRLFFPLLASVWLAAAGGIAWWLESNISVARRVVAGVEQLAPVTWGQRLVSTMLMAAVLSSFFEFNQDGELGLVSESSLMLSPLGRDRSSIVEAAETLADTCVLAARGEYQINQASAFPVGDLIRPEAVMESAAPSPSTPGFTPADRRKERLVVYVFGEPALCLHLAAAGIMTIPISHPNLSDPDGSEPDVPTFLVIGPNAKRTPGFWEQWMARPHAFQSVRDVRYSPGEVTLLDLFSPKWLSQHPEAASQVMELHRVR